MRICRGPIGVAVALVVAATPVTAATSASLACRNVIAQKGLSLSKTALRVLDACHGNRDKGKFAGDCNSLTSADLKGTFASAIAKGAAAIDKKCEPNDPVRNNYEDGYDIDAGLAAAIQAEVEASGVALENGPPLFGDKVRAKCRKAIGRGRSRIVKEVLKLGTQCQKTADKTAVAFGALLANCVAQPLKVGPKVPQALAKACGAMVDMSCMPFPTCVVSSATESGQALLAAIYGEPAICGDGAAEGLEACDDGGSVDGDGCDTNCTATGCGNGISTAGEQCDDGNLVSGDGCTSGCVREFCGDGVTQPGIGEECDDGNGQSEDGCEPNCRLPITVSATITNDSCRQRFQAAQVTFFVYPATRRIRFEVNVENPFLRFCPADNLYFLQGSDQIRVSSTQVPNEVLLTLDDSGAAPCGNYFPGVRITGRFDFPPSFDLAAPFTARFDYPLCRETLPGSCGRCSLTVP